MHHTPTIYSTIPMNRGLERRETYKSSQGLPLTRPVNHTLKKGIVQLKPMLVFLVRRLYSTWEQLKLSVIVRVELSVGSEELIWSLLKPEVIHVIITMQTIHAAVCILDCYKEFIWMFAISLHYSVFIVSCFYVKWNYSWQQRKCDTLIQSAFSIPWFFRLKTAVQIFFG